MGRYWGRGRVAIPTAVKTLMDVKSALLDTSFCIRLLNENDPLHRNVLGFYRHFMDREYRLKISTISIAEYCVRGKLNELPLRHLSVLPFNVDHAVKAGEFAKIAFENKDVLDLSNRLIIPNDNKLFAQVHTDTEVTHFVTSDIECLKVYSLLRDTTEVNFEVINIREQYTSVFGVLPFDE